MRGRARDRLRGPAGPRRDDLAPRGASRTTSGDGVATALLQEAEARAREHGLARLEAWTRDDPRPRGWYEARGFELVHGYLHVYVELDEGLRDLFPVTADGIRPVWLFAHYVGDDREAVRRRFARVHENVLYELRLT